MALVHDVSAHGGCGSLSVCARHTQSLVGACQRSEHLSALLYYEAAIAEVLQFLVFGRNGRCVYHEARCLIAASVRYFVDVFLIVNEHAFLLQVACQVRRRAVVTGHYQSLMNEITCDGAHADATSADEIHGFNVLQFHCLLFISLLTAKVLLSSLSLLVSEYYSPQASFTTSSAMTSAEFFSPSALMFSLSDASLLSFPTV